MKHVYEHQVDYQEAKYRMALLFQEDEPGTFVCYSRAADILRPTLIEEYQEEYGDPQWAGVTLSLTLEMIVNCDKPMIIHGCLTCPGQLTDIDEINAIIQHCVGINAQYTEHFYSNIHMDMRFRK